MKSSVVDVSVVIPARNAAHFICDAVHSALHDQGVTVEVIVVDNASSDHTKAAVESAFGSRVRVVHEPALGCANARNTGVRASTGAYIAFLDADDVWLPGKLRRQVRELESRPEVGLVFTYGYEFLHPGLNDEQRAGYRCRAAPTPFLIASSLLAARATISRIGEFPNVSAGEFVAWYGWAQSLGIQTSVVPETYLLRRVHADNTSRQPHVAGGWLRATKWLMERRRQAG
jgi:glycosyltransferase involved in cell wall biosynthesis